MINKKNILGVGITCATQREVLEYIVKNLQNFKKKFYIVTPNPEILVLANKDKAFKDVLNRADLALTDGVGLIIAAKFMGKPLRDRFAGVDLVKSLCKEVSGKPITVGFLGGRDGVAEKTAECLRKKYPGLRVGFVGEEWPNGPLGRLPHVADGARLFSRGPAASLPPTSAPSTSSVRAVGSPSSGVTPLINPSVDILFVAFGAPKQEFWISENLDKIPVKVAVGVGGTFDYIGGRIPRAPKFMRSVGLEWSFRLVVQPWRIKRQLSLIKFVWLVLKEKLNPAPLSRY